MMKKALWTLLSLFILSTAALSVSAMDYVHDNADILTDSEEAYLNGLAELEGQKYGISIVILTEDGIDGMDPMLYAADFYDYGGFLDNGVIMFLEMEERDWRVVNTGHLMNVILDYELDYIADNVVSYFSNSDYVGGFEQFIIISSALCDYSLNGTFTGDHILYDYDPDSYSYDNTVDDEYYDDYYDDGYGSYDEEFEADGSYYLIAFGVSLLIAFIVCSVFKSQLNIAVRKSAATDYFRSENAEITHSTDRFLYSRTSKVRKSSDNNSSGRSSGGTRSFSGSSGRSHSGGGGKF